MRAELISIGNELLSGYTVNTNAAWMGDRLSTIGIEVVWGTVIGDDADELSDAFERAWGRAGLTIVTGGLGPTHDDITRSVFCDVFDRSLVADPTVLAHIEELFRQRGREITPSNTDQANVPKDTDVLFNDWGTAPGFWHTDDIRHFVVLPGVPREMKALMQERVLPRLEGICDGGAIVNRTLRTSGIPESILNERLHGMDGLEMVASLPSPTGTLLRATVKSQDRAAADERADEIVRQIEARAAMWIVSHTDEPVESIVGRELCSRHLSVATAESCTGGLVTSRLTDVAGSSNYVLGGDIVYSNDEKVRRLGVRESNLAIFGAVSGQVAREMSEGVRVASSADVGLAVTGIAGPSAGTATKPVGTVYMALSHKSGIVTERHQFGANNDRKENKERSAHAVLDMLRRWLLEQR
ncbi:MAG: competence/damage-inducible protein A [Candidatus Latescibacteria bacterium]|jgi:nicotinamide-nucleotide amidase|nr:competence/damage-inducible protein A [Candidatus Latescibacterota bacterium]